MTSNFPFFTLWVLFEGQEVLKLVSSVFDMKTTPTNKHITGDFTLISELMTIAPAFTIGLCGLSAQETEACYH